MKRCTSCRQPSVLMETGIFIETPSLDDRQPRLKTNLTDHKMEAIIARHQTGISRSHWGKTYLLFFLYLIYYIVMKITML